MLEYIEEILGLSYVNDEVLNSLESAGTNTIVIIIEKIIINKIRE